MKQLYLFATIFFTAIPISSTAAPLVNIETKYYSVEGTTPHEIRNDLNRKTPVRENGKNFDAYTSWYVKWYLWWNKSKGSCVITRVKTTVDVRYTLPKLQNIDSVSESLKTQWITYITALQNHENGHKNIGVNAAKEIEQAIENINPSSSCKQLEADANQLGYDIIEKYSAIEKEFDRKTNHGMNTGAVFP